MATAVSDVLVDLSIEEMLTLKEKYKEIKDAHFVYTLIDLAIKWRKFGNKSVTITSPKNSWKTDGSIVVFVDAGMTTIFPFSLDKNYKHVFESLLETKRIPTEPFVFPNIHESYVDIITDITEKWDRKIKSKHENFLYRISINTAKAFEINCPLDIYVKQLSEEHIQRINYLWPHKYKNSDKALEMYLKYNGGYGLFSKDNDELMSWVFQGRLGHINLLQTEEKHKGKGYGKIMLQVMAKHIAENGHIPVATVIVSNVPSVNLFNKLGFEIIGKSYFLNIEGS